MTDREALQRIAQVLTGCECAKVWEVQEVFDILHARGVSYKSRSTVRREALLKERDHVD